MRANLLILLVMLSFFTGCIVEEGHDVLYSLANSSKQKTGEATGSAIVASQKSLFARWRNTARFQTNFDFTSENFQNTFTTTFFIDTLTSCDCFTYISGNESLGTMRISQCFSRAGNYEPYDCKELEGYISYSKSSSELKLLCVSKAICGAYR